MDDIAIQEPDLSNSLTDLAARIRSEHEATARAMKRTIEHALAAGEHLIEAKAMLGHGRWLPWLAKHCAMSDRTARLCMRLARNRIEIEQNGNVANLTVRRAIEILAPQEPEELPPRPLGEGEVEIPIDEVKIRHDLYPRIDTGVIRELVDRYCEFLRDLPAIEVNQRNEVIDGCSGCSLTNMRNRRRFARASLR